MAHLADLKLKYRLFMQAFPYRRIDWRPGARLSKPLPESKIALVTSAGFWVPGQSPFDPSIRGGDWSFREIFSTVQVQTLLIGQKSDAFDHSGIEADRNLALPVDRLMRWPMMARSDHRHHATSASWGRSPRRDA